MVRNRVRRVCFTLNNWTQDELDQMEQSLSEYKYIIGKEVGKEGTPHLQGYVNFGKLKEWGVAKALISDRAHIEKCKGSEHSNWTYCSKEGDTVGNLEEPPKAGCGRKKLRTSLREKVLDCEYRDVAWRPWQQEVIDMLDQEPHPRALSWYWEPLGNVGKSYLHKYLCCTKNVIVCSGKAGDVFNQVNEAIEAEKSPDIILVDIPRSNLEYVSYMALEACKNGCLYSGKYAGGMCIFPVPHVICFANEPPKVGKMSEDRWVIKEIETI